MAKTNGGGYSDIQKANAVAMYRAYGSLQRVSKELGINPRTIKRWIDDDELYVADGFSATDIFEQQKEICRRITPILGKALKQIDDRLPEASAAQAATIFGILTDKMLLLQGNEQHNTTNNIFIDTSGMTDQDKLDLMQRALNRKKELQALQAEAVQVDE